MSQSLLDRLSYIQERVHRIAHEQGRNPSDITLIAVSKMVDAEVIEKVLEAGHRVFGENRVQEALSKWPHLKERYPDVELHMIGHLQSNKVMEAVQLFHMIHTVDRPSLVKALCHVKHTHPVPRLCVQVNTGRESQKSGILPDQAHILIPQWGDQDGLPIEGLMALPPVGQMAAPHFALVAHMARCYGLPTLSMGMSHDYEQAIRLGATHIRLGTALFGHRS